MTTLATVLADATATLKAENDRAFEQSPLSPAEAQMAAEIAPQGDELWAMYRNALSRAQVARDAVRVRLRKGIARAPAFDAGAEAFASVAIELRDVLALIDVHANAQRALYDAAQTICDCLELADAGHAEGVKWTTDLTSRRSDK